MTELLITVFKEDTEICEHDGTVDVTSDVDKADLCRGEGTADMTSEIDKAEVFRGDRTVDPTSDKDGSDMAEVCSEDGTEATSVKGEITEASIFCGRDGATDMKAVVDDVTACKQDGTTDVDEVMDIVDDTVCGWETTHTDELVDDVNSTSELTIEVDFVNICVTPIGFFTDFSLDLTVPTGCTSVIPAQLVVPVLCVTDADSVVTLARGVATEQEVLMLDIFILPAFGLIEVVFGILSQIADKALLLLRTRFLS